MLSYLAEKKNVAAATQKQAFNALVFLYKKVLDIDLNFEQKLATPNLSAWTKGHPCALMWSTLIRHKPDVFVIFYCKSLIDLFHQYTSSNYPQGLNEMSLSYHACLLCIRLHIIRGVSGPVE
ncbi:MAG: hypothetical protein B6I26_05795 [Desulfobacteraceae bacterium 4572_130]|nr:MAG: hypothetical protein B6I26_05795 [Desulfobacteraceae bacterium 4572_130]